MKKIIITAALLGVCASAYAQAPVKRNAAKEEQTTTQSSGLIIGTASLSAPSIDLSQPGAAQLPPDQKAIQVQTAERAPGSNVRPTHSVVNGRPVKNASETAPARSKDK